VPGGDLARPLGFLVGLYGRTKPPPPAFVERFADAVERGDLEVIEAHVSGRPVGVAVLAFRPSVSLGATFASVEDLYVGAEARERGVGRTLLEAVEGRCLRRGVSYVEVQADDATAGFYLKVGFEPEADIRVLSRSYAG